LNSPQECGREFCNAHALKASIGKKGARPVIPLFPVFFRASLARMRAALCSLIVIASWSTAAGAQSKDTGWFISDIGTGVIPQVESKASKKGLIIEVRGNFGLVAGQNFQTSKSSLPNPDQLPISAVKLAGLGNKDKKEWSADPVAFGFDSPSGCTSYHLVDSKKEVTDSRVVNGSSVGFTIRDGKFNLSYSEPVPLCIAFDVPKSSNSMMLTFSGTELVIEVSSSGKPAYRQTVYIDESAMTSRTLNAPGPEYPALARTARITGSVVIGMLIAEDGRVLDAQPVRTDNPLLLTGVVDTVLKWKFRPTVIGGVPVRVRTQSTFSFN
jgi:TonB family protein